MEVKIAEDLAPVLKSYDNDLQIQAKLVPEKVVLDGYLNHGFGNAYDFDQKEPLEGFF